MSVTVELGPDGVLESGKIEILKKLECFLSKSFINIADCGLGNNVFCPLLEVCFTVY